jgi:hypothetical protein
MGAGGVENVVAFLKNMDLSEFNPYAPPRKTEAFRFMMQSDENEVDEQLESILVQMGEPIVFSLAALRTGAKGRAELENFMSSSKNDRSLFRKLDRLGYLRLGNPDDVSGRWRVGASKHTFYAKKNVSMDERCKLARKFVSDLSGSRHLRIVLDT